MIEARREWTSAFLAGFCSDRILAFDLWLSHGKGENYRLWLADRYVEGKIDLDEFSRMVGYALEIEEDPRWS